MPTRDQVLRLIRDDRAVRSIVGLYTVAAAQRAFVDQRSPDGTPWPARYPNQAEDHLNVAGALEDLRTGADIKKRRYDQRPAGRDTGDLLGRLSFDVSGDSLTIGSDVPYAKKFQVGGESTQTLDSQTIANLVKFLAKKRRSEKRRAREAGRSVRKTVEEVRLGPVLGRYRSGVREWKTTSPPRPFVQLGEQDSDDLAAQLLEAAERY